MPERVHLSVHGAVQGVGFRPFVYRLARELQLHGWVLNAPQGVFIEAEGPREVLDAFIRRLGDTTPAPARIAGIEASWLDVVPYDGFEIRESRAEGAPRAFVLPDLATCDECRRDIADPANRRYRYPFTNCTHCGPRFTIVHRLPYDRSNTTMRAFEMCDRCREEYQDPADRRFHAQPNACPVCGPHLALWDRHGETLATRGTALDLAVAALSSGRIVAVKGIGGFHLMVDAASSEAVSRLRARKHREEKPFALMFPTLDAARHACVVEDDEVRLLLSAEAPIVLLRRRADAPVGLADEVAPGNPYLGIMLPYSPLHHLLVGDLGRPVVATSGNLSDEPICIDEYEALDRLGGIADAFLVHNRPIVRHVDDSIVRLMLGRELVVRRARGYAPLPVHLRMPVPPMLAVGGHYKNTVVAAAGTEAFISQHIGDLETETSAAAFRAVLGSVQSLYQITPAVVVADRHPGYVSTRYAQALGVPLVQVQHHHAHVASCMAENDLDGPVLGVSWDGTGYGDDGTVWGGEFLRVEGGDAVRVGAFRRFRLPGGEAAIREPRRSALGALYALYGEAAGALDYVTTAFDPAERRLLLQALARGVNSPITSSAGRLFDAVAALSGLRARASYEGQAAFELECQVDETSGDAYPVVLDSSAAPFVLDWGPALRALLDDVAASVSRGVIAARFHNMLAAAIVAAARQVGQPRVVLTGGCFQNRVLTERAVTALRAAGFRPYWHQRVPPNDGGLALGQVAAAALSHAATGPIVTQQISDPARARPGQQAPAMT